MVIIYQAIVGRGGHSTMWHVASMPMKQKAGYVTKLLEQGGGHFIFREEKKLHLGQTTAGPTENK